MAKKSDRRSQSKKATKNDAIGKEIAQSGRPRTISVAQKGIHTGSDFAEMMSCLMSDIIEGKITPNIANATCNAGGKLLKIVEMELKYNNIIGKTKKTLNLLMPA